MLHSCNGNLPIRLKELRRRLLLRLLLLLLLLLGLLLLLLRNRRLLLLLLRLVLLLAKIDHGSGQRQSQGLVCRGSSS